MRAFSYEKGGASRLAGRGARIAATLALALFGAAVSSSITLNSMAFAAGDELLAGTVASATADLKAQAETAANPRNLNNGSWEVVCSDVYDDEISENSDLAALIGLSVRLDDAVIAAGGYEGVPDVLSAGTDYEFAWLDANMAPVQGLPRDPGSYYVRVTGVDPYTGVLSAPFVIFNHLNIGDYTYERSTLAIWTSDQHSVLDDLVNGLSVKRVATATGSSDALVYGTDYRLKAWYWEEEVPDAEPADGDLADDPEPADDPADPVDPAEPAEPAGDPHSPSNPPTEAGKYYLIIEGTAGQTGGQLAYRGELLVPFEVLDSKDIGNYEATYTDLIARLDESEVGTSSNITLDTLNIELSNAEADALPTGAYDLEGWYSRTPAADQGSSPAAEPARMKLDSAPSVTQEGSYSAKLVGAGDFTGELWLDFDILNTTDIGSFEVSSNARVEYLPGDTPVQMSAIIRSVALREGGQQLAPMTDYDAKEWYARAADGTVTLLGQAPGAQGDYRLVIEGKGSYSGTKAVDFTIWDSWDIGNAEATIDGPLTFTQNSPLTQDALVEQGLSLMLEDVSGTPRELVFNRDYRFIKWQGDVEGISSNDNIALISEGGRYTFTFEGLPGDGAASYRGTKDVEVLVNDGSVEEEHDLSNATIQGLPATYEYTGSPINAISDLSVRIFGRTLAQDNDYSVSYQNNTGPGVATITVTGMGDYANFQTGTFNIVVPMSQVAIDVDESDLVYDNRPLEPPVTVTWNGRTLVQGTDYTLEYANNVNACDGPTTGGTGAEKAHVVVNAVEGSDFAGSKTVDFTISKRRLSIVVDDARKPVGFPDPEFTGTVSGFAQGHGVQDVAAKVGYRRIDGDAGKEEIGDDITIAFYTVDLSSNYTVGSTTSAKLTIYEPTDEEAAGYVEDLIRALPDTPTAADKEAIDAAQAAYDGLNDRRKGLVGDDAKRRLADVQAALAAVLDLNNATATLEYATTPYNGSAQTPSVTVRDSAGTLLVRGTDYTVEYANNTNVGTATMTIRGMSPYSGTLTRTFRISSAALASATLSQAIYTYNGAPCIPAVTVRDSAGTVLERDVHYTATYRDNTNAGTATVTVTGMSPYSGTLSRTFTIQKAQLQSMTLSQASYTYDGAAKTPGATVRGPKDGSSGRPLSASSDYTLSYSNNMNAGTAQVAATGKGNYSGTVSTTFKIEKAPLSAMTLSQTSYAYDGEEKSPGARVLGPKNGRANQVLSSGSDYVLSLPEGRTLAGSYTVTAMGTGNYTGTKSATFSITKGAITWQRLGGQVALDTMATIVDAGNWSKGGTVVIATAGDYYDGLTANGVAGLARAPIVMTDGSSLSSQARTTIAKLAPSRVIVCGGPEAVTNSVANAAVAAAGTSPTLQRLYGQMADDTAVAIYQEGAKAVGGSWAKTAFVCTDNGYWDALSAAPVSYVTHMPIFLTREEGATISDSTVKAMKDGGIASVYVVGGEMAVKPAVVSKLRAAGITVTDRLWGDDAVLTSVKVAQFGLDQGMSANYMGIATTNGYWDALAGAALCGYRGGVIALASGPSSATIANVAKANANTIARGYVFGGTEAVSADTYNALPK